MSAAARSRGAALRVAVRGLLAVFGSMAVDGPAIEWIATHRTHPARQTTVPPGAAG